MTIALYWCCRVIAQRQTADFHYSHGQFMVCNSLQPPLYVLPYHREDWKVQAGTTETQPWAYRVLKRKIIATLSLWARTFDIRWIWNAQNGNPKWTESVTLTYTTLKRWTCLQAIPQMPNPSKGTLGPWTACNTLWTLLSGNIPEGSDWCVRIL